MNGARIVLEVPDLRNDRVRLRPWHRDDAPVLSAAWHDPTIVAGGRPPDDRSARSARRWIDGCEVRRRAGVAVDLVVAGVDDEVVHGEVGLSNFDVTRRAAMVGWWISTPSRGQGYASDGVQLLVDWVLATRALAAVLARIDPANVASARVAEKAGFTVLRAGRGGEVDVWVRR